MNKEIKVIAQNKKANHDYFIETTYEAGLVLTGTEIKSIRRGRINLKRFILPIKTVEKCLFIICIYHILKEGTDLIMSHYVLENYY